MAQVGSGTSFRKNGMYFLKSFVAGRKLYVSSRAIAHFSHEPSQSIQNNNVFVKLKENKKLRRLDLHTSVMRAKSSVFREILATAVDSSPVVIVVDPRGSRLRYESPVRAKVPLFDYKNISHTSAFSLSTIETHSDDRLAAENICK